MKITVEVPRTALTEAERQLISQVAQMIPNEPRRKQLLADMESATAKSVSADGSRVAFNISGYERPAYEGQHSFGVQGHVTDQDGGEISIDLYADQNDRLFELELVRADGTGRIIAPDWTSLVLF